MFTSLFLYIWLYLCLLLGWLWLLKVCAVFIVMTVSQGRWTWPVKPQSIWCPGLWTHPFWETTDSDVTGAWMGSSMCGWVGLLSLVIKFFPEVPSCWRRQLDSIGSRGIHVFSKNKIINGLELRLRLVYDKGRTCILIKYDIIFLSMKQTKTNCPNKKWVLANYTVGYY